MTVPEKAAKSVDDYETQMILLSAKQFAELLLLGCSTAQAACGVVAKGVPAQLGPLVGLLIEDEWDDAKIKEHLNSMLASCVSDAIEQMREADGRSKWDRVRVQKKGS